MIRRIVPAVLLALFAGGCAASGASRPAAAAAGEPESLRTRALEAGAAILQTDAPTARLNIYLVGFHPLKDDPQHQFEAHHFCQQVNEDFAQCALYDGNTAAANLNGIEYIISERLFAGLPEAEKSFWHPHNGEILSGQLVAPGLPQVAEHELMESKMNSYGKTWHTWDTTRGADVSLPLGEPALAWSFSRMGEARPELVEQRDQKLGISTEERRSARQDLLPLARPQAGVDALKGAFPGPTQPIPGVVDEKAPR
jgi:hypothetical protein